MNKGGDGSLAGKKVGTHFLLLFYKRRKFLIPAAAERCGKEDGFIKKDLLKEVPK